MKTIIHVNRNRLNSNRKHGTNEPVIAVRQRGKPVRYGHRVEISGPSAVVTGHLSCGARAWMETDSTVKVRRV